MFSYFLVSIVKYNYYLLFFFFFFLFLFNYFNKILRKEPKFHLEQMMIIEISK